MSGVDGFVGRWTCFRTGLDVLGEAQDLHLPSELNRPNAELTVHQQRLDQLVFRSCFRWIEPNAPVLEIGNSRSLWRCGDQVELQRAFAKQV